MANFLSLLCVAATEGESHIDMEENCLGTRQILGSYEYQFSIPTSLPPVPRRRSSGSIISTDTSISNTKKLSISFNVDSSGGRPLSPMVLRYSPTDADEKDSFSPSTDYGNITPSYMDDHTVDISSSDDELSDPNVNLKKRKRVTKEQSRRAKPLTVETLYHIFETLKIDKDPYTGTYHLSLPMLKTADCSSKYFAVTEWQCFRKRIMNHGFQITDEMQATWIRVRPNLQTRTGELVFDCPELRSKYATPCKIKCARERGDVIEIPSHQLDECDREEFNEQAGTNAACYGGALILHNGHTPTSKNHYNIKPLPNALSENPSLLTSTNFESPFFPMQQVADSSANISTNQCGFPEDKNTFCVVENSLEASLRSCLNDIVKGLVNSGQYLVSVGNFDINITMRNSCNSVMSPVTAGCRTAGRGSLQVRVSSINDIKPEFNTSIKS